LVRMERLLISALKTAMPGYIIISLSPLFCAAKMTAVSEIAISRNRFSMEMETHLEEYAEEMGAMSGIVMLQI
ncbi:MAG: hypothetical protein L0Y36_09920, partial [Planctomycetales bacterium]|nr:hypothetical protein [Planctomycetales bacterium]